MSIWVVIVLLVSTLLFYVPAQTVEADGSGVYPPPDTGNWVISIDTYVGNETIYLNGNLTVQNGASLILKNVSLKLNCSSDGQYHIEVLNGGSLKILDLDGNNLTTDDASWITANDTNYAFNFWVRDGAFFEMRSSNLSECGFFWGGVLEKEGLLIETDDAIIDHSLLFNNYRGVALYGSDAVLSNNTIEWNEHGIRATTWSNGTIENNLISRSKSLGLEIDGWDNVVKRSSNPHVRNNHIIESGRGVTPANGILVTDYSSPLIIDNRVINSTEDGIYLGQWCQAVLINNTFDGGGGNYGIASSAPRWVNITNCTVTNTTLYDLSLSQAYFVLINTTFNKSKVKFWDIGSNLTVRWYLHTLVKDNYGNPVEGATVRVRDNANGTYDQNFTTDVDGWARWIVVTEKIQNKSGNLSFTSHNITVTKSGYFEGFAEPNMNQSRYLTITLQADEKPLADAGPDQSVDEDEIVYFDGNNSFDDVGILWYNWSFGDGSFDFGTEKFPNHTYANAGTYIVTLDVTDTIGQWDEDICLVFVNNVGPTADAGSGQIVNEGEVVLFDGSGSTDTPSDQTNLIYTWYFGDGKTGTGMHVDHSYADDGIYTATLIVSDDNGFVDSDSIIVTVNNVAPMIEPVPSRIIDEDSLFTLKINASDVPADTLTFSDNTTLFDINPITGMIEFTPTNDVVGNHSVNLTVVDDDGGLNYAIFNITVENTNDMPTIEPISQQSATEDEEFTLQIDAQDIDVGDVLTYSLTTSPIDMSIDSAGLITWTPTNDDVGTHTVTVKVGDAGGLFDTETFTIIVSNVNDAPTIVTDSLADATEDVFYMAFVHAEDVDLDDTLTYSLDISPTFLSINPLTGLLFGTPDNDDVGTHNLIVNVTDGSDYVTKSFVLNVVNVNDAPVIASSPILTANANELYDYDVIASDVDTGDVLTYSLVEGPEGMVINGSKITWTPTNEQEGKTYQVIVEVTDGEITATQSFVVSVGEIPEGTNVWLALVMGLVGGLISGVIITWIMNQRKKEEEIEESERRE